MGGKASIHDWKPELQVLAGEYEEWDEKKVPREVS
jgi:hypothetical protein